MHPEWKRGGAYHVYAVLESASLQAIVARVAHASTVAITVRSYGHPATGLRSRGGNRVGVKKAPKVIIFTLKARVVLLELANFEEGWRQSSNLVGAEPDSNLKFCDSLLKLEVWRTVKILETAIEDNEEAHLVDVRLSLCAVACLCFCVTAAFRALRACRIVASNRRHQRSKEVT